MTDRFTAAKEIPLTQGQVAIVDAEDYKELSKYKWYAKRQRTKIYAARNVRVPGKKRQKPVLMHRQILNAPTRVIVDHANRNGLDNRRANLRFCSAQQNLYNSGIPRNNKSGFKGVSWNKKTGKWVATIRHEEQFIFLGQFTKPEFAAIAYNSAATVLFKKFACLNEVDA